MAFFQHIQTRNELADYLTVPRKVLSHVLYVKKIENSYTSFEIPKRSGGTRIICVPDAELMGIQKKLALKLQQYRSKLWSDAGVSPNISHAFEKKKSIFTNAKIHRNKRYVLNIDLQDFFGSIHFGRVCGYFQKNMHFKMPYELAVVMAQLCCYEKKLPQGAPTSPIISNMLFEIVDFRIMQLAKKYKLDYTRYADDLTFSTNDKNFLVEYDAFYKSISGLLKHQGFAINESKTRLAYRDSRQTVTGLVVNKKINIDRRYYKKTRAMADSQYKTGEYLVDNEPGTMQQLEGRFAFINQLDLHNGGDDCNSTHHMYHLNGREKQYQKFLFYKYFFANEKPLIVTEGKTDILYIRAALMNLHERYPNLVQLCPDGKYDFKISFFRRSKRFRQLFGMSMDGADAIQQIYDFYVGAGALPKYYKHFMNYQKSTPANPVILVFDNELNNKSKPLCKFINKTTSSAERERFKDIIGKDLTASIIHGANLFLATHQLVDGKQECEIEDLFDQETRSTIIEGRELSLDNDYDRKKCYGKDEFSKYILSHYKTIDFTRFTTLLDNMAAIISDYREHD